MSGGLSIDEELVRRLPLPLARLYCAAHNAKSAKDRHHTAYYLWEAALKLLGSVALVEYAALGRPDPKLAERLKNLARPTIGHWREFVRLLVPALADAGDAPFAAAARLFTDPAPGGLPQVARLRDELRNLVPKGDAGAGLVAELFDRLVSYRNQEFGHGAVGRRREQHYADVGQSLLLGVSEVLGRLDVLAGRRLRFLEEVRRSESGGWQVRWWDLTGESPRVLEPAELPDTPAAQGLLPNRLYLVAPAMPARLLSPLAVFDAEAGEVFFLNSRRGQRRAEYLCYGSGETAERAELAADQCRLLEGLLGTPVDPAAADELARQALADDRPGPEARGTEDRGKRTDGTASPGPRSSVLCPSGFPAPSAVRRVGDFELTGELGNGRFGVVYRARQPSLEREVALKCLLPTGNPKAEARFHREVKALARVDHRNLVKIYTSGSEAGQWFYAMELVDGSTLAAVCGKLAARHSSAHDLDLNTWNEAVSTACEERRAAPAGGDEATPAEERPAAPAPARAPAAGAGYVRRVVDLVRQVAEAAHALHQAGVVHRDIKPGNVMVTAGGERAILVDLGLAQLADEVDGSLSRTTQFVGTLRYASPEQLLPAGRLDGRSDIYSLGVMLWELLTLRPMYGATDATPVRQLMERIEFDDAERVRRYHPGIAPDLEAIVLKCLRKKPDHRYATAAELAQDLGCWLRGEPVPVHPPTLRYVLGKYVRRHRARVVVAAAVVFGLVAGAVALGTSAALMRIDRARREAEDARGQAERARDDAKEARDDAVRAREEVRGYAVRYNVANGVRLLDGRDRPAALGWFANALRLDEGDPARELPHRVRLAATLWGCARPQQFWLHDGMTCAALSPDGRFAATAGADNTVRVWDAAKGDLVVEFRHAALLAELAFGPGGRQVLATEAGGAVRLWDVAARGPVRELAHGGRVRYAGFSPDGSRVVTAGEDGLARLWDAATGEPTASPWAHGEPVVQAAFSPDGRRLATAGKSGKVKIWEVAGVAGPVECPGGSEVLRLAFSPDGGRVLALGTGDQGGSVSSWDAKSGRLIRGARDLGPAEDGAFSPDGRRAAGASSDGELQITDLSRPDRNEPILRELSAKGIVTDRSGRARPRIRSSAAGVRVSFSPDGRWVVTAGENNSVRLWDAETRRAVRQPLRHAAPVVHASFSRDGRHVFTASKDGTARLWEVALTAEPGPLLLRHGSPVIQATVTPDNRQVLTASRDGTVRAWDAESGQPVLAPIRHGGPVAAVDFTRDGRRALTAGEDGLCRVWDLTTGGRACEVAHGGKLLHAALSPDGRLLVTAGEDGNARVWDAADGKLLTPTPLAHPSRLAWAAFSPDGQSLVTAANTGFAGAESQITGQARVWDWRQGRPRSPPLPHDGGISVASFSPDGRRVLTAGAGGTAQVWDAGSGEPVGPPLQHEAGLTWAEFSPDGRRVLTASRDRSARVWDATSGEPVTPPLQHNGPIDHAAFSPDGRLVVTADGVDVDIERNRHTGEARVWDAASGEPLTPLLHHDRHVSFAAFGLNGGRVATASEDGSARVWDFEVDARPAADWAELDLLLGGKKFHPDGRAEAVAPAALQAAWQAQRDRHPADFAAPEAQVLAWHRRQAEACEADRDPFAAAWHLSRLIEAEPGSVALRRRRGEARASAGDLRSAALDFDRAAALDPADWHSRLRLGDCHAGLGDFAGAVDDCTRAIDLAPGEPVPWVSRGRAHAELGRLDRARADADKAAGLLAGRPEPGELIELRGQIAGMVRDRFLGRWHPGQSGSGVRLDVDRADRSYREGEEVRLTVGVDQAGYLYLFRCDAADRIVCLFPNRSQPTARVTAGQIVTFPPGGADSKLRVEPPFGLQSFKAVITREPLRGLPLEDLTKGTLTPLGGGQEAIDRMTALGVELGERGGECSEQAVEISAGTKTVGLFVGVDKYKDPKIPTLQTGQRDATQVAQVMRERAGVREAVVLVNEQATRKNIEDQFQELARRTRPGDTIIFYWSGTGSQSPRGDGGNIRSFLVPHDARLDSAQSRDETMIFGDDLARWARALSGRKVMAVLDTCYSGGFADELAKVQVGLLASCTGKQECFERMEADHAVYTFYLLEYLRRAQGPLDPRAAYEYVKGRAAEYIRKNFEGRSQTAVFSPGS